MNSEEKEKDKEPEEKEEKKIYKTKDQILDESFRKAEILKIGKPEKKVQQRIIKKPFIKIGIFIVIIALIGIFLINYVPFMYINYETEYGTIKEFFSFKELQNNQFYPEEINSLFESTCYNCSDNSESYIGLKINDFTDAPKITIYIFYIMILTGSIFTIFILIDRKKDFSENTFTIVHSIFTVFIIITGVLILLVNIKFLDANLLQQINKPFIKALGFNSVQLLFFIPYLLILFSICLFIVGLILMRLNLNKAFNKDWIIRSHKENLSYKYRSKT